MNKDRVAALRAQLREAQTLKVFARRMKDWSNVRYYEALAERLKEAIGEAKQ